MREAGELALVTSRGEFKRWTNGADPSPVVRQLAAEAAGFLAASRRIRVPKQAIAAALPAVLARRDLRRLSQVPRARGFGDKFAVVLAGLTGML